MKVASASSTDANDNGITQSMKFCFLEAARHPTDMPRNEAIRTMFVKNVRKTTIEPKKRMQASSKKRIRKLIRSRSRNGRVRATEEVDDSAYAIAEGSASVMRRRSYSLSRHCGRGAASVLWTGVISAHHNMMSFMSTTDRIA